MESKANLGFFSKTIGVASLFLGSILFSGQGIAESRENLATVNNAHPTQLAYVVYHTRYHHHPRYHHRWHRYHHGHRWHR